MHHLRGRLSLVAALLACLVATLPLQSGGAQAAGGGSILNLVPATIVTVFHPLGAKGKPVSGTCAMGESLAVSRTDAWRCMVGNIIYDPCFASAPHATSVICGALPSHPYGITVRLAKPLPAHSPVRAAQPWLLQLGDGTTCGFLTGATFGVHGERANYGCSDQQYIIGLPQTGRVWYAVKVHLGPKPGPQGPTADRIYVVSVTHVWR
jgi:hypothetical protein